MGTPRSQPLDVEHARAVLTALRVDRWRSEAELADAVGCDAGRLRAVLAALVTLGAPVQSLAEQGVRLLRPVDLLDAACIRARLDPSTAARLDSLAVLAEVDSTNRLLLEREEPGVHACLAECQTAGRGRSGRGWVSPFAASLYLSLRWPLARPAAALGGLSLAAGVAVAETLRARGARSVGLKWPNDLLAGDAKLGGLLVEVAGRAAATTTVVVGVGVNVSLGAAASAIDQPWTDMTALLGTAPDRNELAAGVLDALSAALAGFEVGGFVPFRARFAALDRLAGRRVSVLAEPAFEGVAMGVDEDGALRLDDGTTTRRVLAGEVSVRTRPTGRTAP